MSSVNVMARSPVLPPSSGRKPSEPSLRARRGGPMRLLLTGEAASAASNATAARSSTARVTRDIVRPAITCVAEFMAL